MPDGSGPAKTGSAPGFVGALYGRAASFGRDVFHYVVTGAVFVFVCSVPWWPQIYKLLKSGSSELQPIVTDAGFQVSALLVAGILLFCIGHVLLSVGFWLRNKILLCRDRRPGGSVSCWDCWDGAWNWILTRTLFCRGQRGENCRARKEIANVDACTSRMPVGEERDVHIRLEMAVFDRRPQLHANYIERYNTLWHLRLGLAVSLLCSGIVGPAIGCWWGNCHALNICVGVFAFLSGIVLMRQHLVTNTSFLNRVLAAYQIVQQEAEKPATRS